MPLYINLVCDHPDCGKVQPVVFEDDDETYGGMLAFLRSVGWTLEMRGATVAKAYCPDGGTLVDTPDSESGAKA